MTKYAPVTDARCGEVLTYWYGMFGGDWMAVLVVGEGADPVCYDPFVKEDRALPSESLRRYPLANYAEADVAPLRARAGGLGIELPKIENSP